MTGIMFARVHARAVRAFARLFTYGNSIAGKPFACAMALTLSCALVPSAAFAADGTDGVPVAAALGTEEADGSSEDVEPASASGPQVAATPAAPMLPSALASGSSIVSADVMLGADETIVGSFTVDGLTFAVNEGGVTLVSVDLSAVLSDDAERSGASAAGMGVEGFLSIPPSITYEGMAYDVTAVGAYAFYLSGATDVVLPASVVDVDDRAFRSSDVASVQVAEGNPAYAAYDGVLYSADLTSLLLIPEGRSEGVRIPYTAEEVPAEAFSHVSAVSAIFVDADSPTYSSEDGLLYNVDGTVLLRVAAGAVDIVIRDGCTTIAAGAMAGCAKLETIAAPASVVSISPDVFESVPTVSLPAIALQDQSVVAPRVDAESAPAGNSVDVKEPPAQLTAIVALSSSEESAPQVDPQKITVNLANSTTASFWEKLRFAVETEGVAPVATVQTASTKNAANVNVQFAISSSARGFLLANGSTNWVSRASTHTDIISDATGFLFTGTKLSFSKPGEVWEFALNANGGGVAAVTVKETGFHLTAGTTYSAFACTLVLSPANYSISWNANGGSCSVPSSSVASDCQVSAPSPTRAGYTCSGWYSAASGGSLICGVGGATPRAVASQTYYAHWTANTIVCSWNATGGSAVSNTSATYSPSAKVPVPSSNPTRDGYLFAGWWTAASGGTRVTSSTGLPTSNPTYYAHWDYADFDVSFDTDSEPGDKDYPGDEKDNQIINIEGGQVPIEDPQRPGYVFQGWVIPNGDDTEAVDQDLVYQGDDGKWYVDAAKLPDYATDGKVELTARWTSIISVDVPNAVTFYADVVTQGNESREGAASSAFGQSKVANQSQVDLRVVGLESSAVETTDTILGADSILKKASAATPATSAQKLLSLYPSTKAWTAEELQDPSAVGGEKATTAVDFDLDDILLEKSFVADDFTIPAGDTLNMGYRLNLEETGQLLDYDKLSTLEDGQSASIANVSYCFATKGAHVPTATGTKSDPLYIEYEGRIYGLQDIKASADCIAELGEDSPCYGLYKGFLDAQVTNNGNPGSGPYFQVKIKDEYWDLQLIGIRQDAKSDGTGNAGLTFQLRDIFAFDGNIGHPGSGTYASNMNAASNCTGGWQSAYQREVLRTSFYGYLDEGLRVAIAPVDKFQQLYGGTTAAYLQKTTDETVWLPSFHEVFGVVMAQYNESEGLANIAGYTPFQYMAYQPGGTGQTNAAAIKKYYTNAATATANVWWLRSARRYFNDGFCAVSNAGLRSNFAASNKYGVAPCFCL